MVIAEHTVNETLLSDGWIIDVGARNFAFSKWFVERGYKVLAVEPDPEVKPIPGVVFENAALSNFTGTAPYKSFGNGTGNYIGEGDIFVRTITYHDLLKKHGINTHEIEVLKLDCEGSEYDILPGIWFGPHQITVEFHEHTQFKKGRNWIDDLVYGLISYDVEQHDWEQRHGAGFNYWDTLLVDKIWKRQRGQ
jgi:FkbM family methyltransferase